jgi:hypothetical protein
MRHQHFVMEYLKIQYRMFCKCMAGSIILHFGVIGVIIGVVEGYGN